MTDLTKTQTKVVTDLVATFSKLNQQDNEVGDLIAQIENALDAKRKLRIELNAICDANSVAIEEAVTLYLLKITPLLEHYGYKINCKYKPNRMDGGTFRYELNIDWGPSSYTVTGRELEYVYIILVTDTIDGVTYTKSPIPKIATGAAATTYYANFDSLTEYLKNKIMSKLKNRI